MCALCLAVVVNCLDRHAEEAGGRVALIWEKDQPGEHETVTYQYAWVVGLGGRGHGHTITLPLSCSSPCVLVHAGEVLGAIAWLMFSRLS